MPVDSAQQLVHAHRALKILTKDFKELEAYKKGYIDKDGTRIIPHWSDLDQSQYIKHYDIFTRFMIILKQFLEKLPSQEQRKFQYTLLLKALREEVVSVSSEVEGTKYLLELRNELRVSHKAHANPVMEDLNKLLFSEETLTEGSSYNILKEYEDIMTESMVAGVIANPSPGEGIAGVNDAQEDPSKNTVVNKKFKKKKKKKDPTSKKIRKIIDKL